MYTFCPNCQTIFRLTTRHLARAGGYTRCGECHRVYNAIDYLYEELAETREAQDLIRQSRQDQAEAEAGAEELIVDAQVVSDVDEELVEIMEAPDLGRQSMQNQAEAGAGELIEDAQVISDTDEELVEIMEAPDRGHQSRQDQVEVGAEELIEDAQVVSDMDDRTPEEVLVSADGWSRRTLTLPGAFSSAAIVFLALLLAGQWVFFNRADLVREQGWRPGLEQFCKYLQCSLPLQVDLSQLKLLNRDVRQHPRVGDALLVNATLLNQADFNQPYPVLEVSFSDLGGNPVAVRHFRPTEYINDGYIITHGMSPGEPVPVMLEILDPGEAAVSHQFGFL